jgi:hypothetical protein
MPQNDGFDNVTVVGVVQPGDSHLTPVEPAPEPPPAPIQVSDETWDSWMAPQPDEQSTVSGGTQP